MSTTIDDIIRQSKPTEITSFINLQSVKNGIIAGGVGIASIIGVYSLVKYLGRKKESPVQGEIGEGNESQVTMISQYMDSLSTSGLKLVKKGKPLVNYGNTCFVNSALQV